MKSLLLTLIISILVTSGYSQGVGIGTNNPNGSSMLEINATNKGVIIPQVILTGSTDATTITTPATSLLVYNTATISDVVPGYYYNSGTSSSPVWIRLNTSSIATGTYSGETITWNSSSAKWQITGTSSLALGNGSGQISQGNGAVALGYRAGFNNQGTNAVALGNQAGYTSQGANALALGTQAGNTSQGTYSIALGSLAGYNGQSSYAVALGERAGFSAQGTNAVALGYRAGFSAQGINSIAIGANAGVTNQASNSIILNASGVSLDGPTSNATYISPIRATSQSTNVLVYDNITKEMSYNNAKTFVINHPTKPDSYLVHACLEGPEAGVYYRGESKIENNQSVVVKLPDYVSSFATNFSINITPIYSDDSDENIVYRTSRVKDNAFTVYGKNGSFYWIVYGQRGKVDVEPKKSDVQVSGEGPYKYIKPGK